MRQNPVGFRHNELLLRFFAAVRKTQFKLVNRIVIDNFTCYYWLLLFEEINFFFLAGERVGNDKGFQFPYDFLQVVNDLFAQAERVVVVIFKVLYL